MELLVAVALIYAILLLRVKRKVYKIKHRDLLRKGRR